MDWRIFKAQVWELLRLTRVELLIRLFLPIILFYVLGSLVGGNFQFLNEVAFYSVLLASLVSGLWLASFRQIAKGGFSLTLGYPRPQTSVQLVSVPLLWLTGSNLVLYLALRFSFYQLFGVTPVRFDEFPLVLLASVTIATVSWATHRVGERVLASIILGVGAIVWFGKRHILVDPMISSVLGDRDLLTMGEMVVMICLTILLWIACIYFVHQQRSGEERPPFQSGTLFRFADQSIAARSGKFPGPLRAHFWFELRKALPRALMIVGGGVTLMALAVSTVSVAGQPFVLNLMWAASLCITPLALLVVTSESVMGLKYRGHTSNLSVYEATQPTSIGNSVLLKVTVSGGLTLVGSTVMAVAGLGCTAFFAGDAWDDAYAHLVEAREMSLLVMGMWVAGAFGVAVLIAALCMAASLLTMSFGYAAPRLEEYNTVGASLIVALIVPIVVPKIGSLAGLDLMWVAQLGAVFWGLFLIVVAVLSLWRCARAGYFEAGSLVFSFVAWYGLLFALWMLLRNTPIDLPQTNLYGYVLIAGLLCVPPASLAWASMSLAALRNR